MLSVALMDTASIILPRSRSQALYVSDITRIRALTPWFRCELVGQRLEPEGELVTEESCRPLAKGQSLQGCSKCLSVAYCGPGLCLLLWSLSLSPCAVLLTPTDLPSFRSFASVRSPARPLEVAQALVPLSCLGSRLAGPRRTSELAPLPLAEADSARCSPLIGSAPLLIANESASEFRRLSVRTLVSAAVARRLAASICPRCPISLQHSMRLRF